MSECYVYFYYSGEMAWKGRQNAPKTGVQDFGLSDFDSQLF